MSKINISKIEHALLEQNARGTRALPTEIWHIPIHDKAHVYQAIGRFGMFKFSSVKKRVEAAHRIAEIADRFGIKYRKERKASKADNLPILGSSIANTFPPIHFPVHSFKLLSLGPPSQIIVNGQSYVPEAQEVEMSQPPPQQPRFELNPKRKIQVEK